MLLVLERKRAGKKSAFISPKIPEVR